jgi:hypothetical protein
MSTVAQLAHSPRQLCKVRIELDLSKEFEIERYVQAARVPPRDRHLSAAVRS